MDIIITLTSVGIDQGAIFDLYSNVDSFTTPFDTNVALASLQAGYTASAPANTTVVRVLGQEAMCPFPLDIYPIYTTTTSTTLPPVGCGASAGSGGVGVTEYSIPLETFGGVLVIDFNAYGVPDKLEILHDGVKVATSGMSVPNSGPFDNLYGDPTVPTNGETVPVDQFIGTSKGIPPTREADILSETGLSFTSTGQQLVWYTYTENDVINDPNAIVRVTGPTGTAWIFTRLCPEVTTTTTTTSSSTTTTTTTLAGLAPGLISNSSEIAASCIATPTLPVWLLKASSVIAVGDYVYDDQYGTSPFAGNGDYYVIEDTEGLVAITARVTLLGEILAPTSICYVIPDYTSVAADVPNVNEGGTVTFTVTTQNVIDATTVGYTITGVSSADIVGGALSGLFTINSNTANVAITLVEDFLTEGPETLTLTLDATDSAGTVTNGLNDSCIINDTSQSTTTTTTTSTSTTTTTTTLAPAYTGLVGTPGTVNEGSGASWIISHENIPALSSIGWTITGIQAADLVGGQLTGIKSIGGTGTTNINVTVAEDFTTEGTETMTLTLDAVDSNGISAGLFDDIIIQDSSTNTTTTTTTSSSTTTTTTTTAFPGELVQLNLSSTTDLVDACALTLDSIGSVWTNNQGTLSVGDQVYSDLGGLTPFIGNSEYYYLVLNGVTNTYSAQIDGSGIVIGTISICPT